MKYFFYIVVLIFITLVVSCKNVSKYAIDDKANIKIDTNLLGIWKAKEDTDKANYILIQTNYDVHHHLEEYKFGTDAIYDSDYFITYMNRRGKNPFYQQFYSFLSEVKRNKLMNISYTNFETGWKGFFFVRLLNVNTAHNSITTTIIADTTLRYLTGSKEIRKRIEENIDNPAFYSDTLHFYKVSGYHLSINESVFKAN